MLYHRLGPKVRHPGPGKWINRFLLFLQHLKAAGHVLINPRFQKMEEICISFPSCLRAYSKHLTVSLQIASKVAAPLAKTNEIVILSGEGSRVTGEVNRLLAELPVSVNALTGVDLSKVKCFLMGMYNKYQAVKCTRCLKYTCIWSLAGDNFRP